MIKGTCPYCFVYFSEEDKNYIWMYKVNKFMCKSCGKLFGIVQCGKCGTGWFHFETIDNTFAKKVWDKDKDTYAIKRFSKCCGSDNLVTYIYKEPIEPELKDYKDFKINWKTDLTDEEIKAFKKEQGW